MSKRLLIGIITGSLLGVICVVGAQLRYTDSIESLYIFSFWFNRLIMGIVFGLLPITERHKTMIIRGLSLGLLVSFAFYSATEFYDLTGFLAGGVYGIIIEYVAYYFISKKKVNV